MGSSSETQTKAPSIWSRTFVALCCVSLFQSLGQMMMITIMPLYARDMGADATMVGFVVGSFAMTALIVRPFASPAFDSFPKKPILAAGIVVMAVSCWLYGLVSSIPALIAVRMLHGCAMGCTGPLALALVTEALPLERMGSGLGIYSLTQAISQAVGPACGLFAIDLIGFETTFHMSSALLIVALCLLTLVHEVKRDSRPPYRLALNRSFAKNAVAPAFLTCLCTTANTAIMSFVAIYGGLRGVGGIGIYFTVQAIVMLATRPLFGMLADRLGFTKVIIPALGIYAIAFVILSQATTLWMFLVAAVVCACGFGALSPQLQAVAMSSVPRTRSGAASSTNFTGIDIAQLVGPTSAGMLVEFFAAQTGSEVDGYSYMYLSVIVIVTLSIAFLLAFHKMIERNIRHAEEENRHDGLTGAN